MKTLSLRTGSLKGMIILLAFLGNAFAVHAVPSSFSQLSADGLPNTDRDSIQAVLWELSITNPDMVSYIPETKRLYLSVRNRSAISEALVEKLQNAFYHDVSSHCILYGVKYLADWKALIGKAARESFWGTSYLANRTFNYFGIWRKNKPWACESFNFCDDLIRNDPTPAEFFVFPDFEACLWMFIHTMYSEHYLDRLPDWGMRVAEAIQWEREKGVHYWDNAKDDGTIFTVQLEGDLYTAEELIYTWSQHPKFNLCLQCDRQSDLAWVTKVEDAEGRQKD